MAGFKAKNRRRIELVKKKYREGLEAAEALELAALSLQVSSHIRRKHPRDTSAFEEFAAYVDGLKARIAARKGLP